MTAPPRRFVALVQSLRAACHREMVAGQSSVIFVVRRNRGRPAAHMSVELAEAAHDFRVGMDFDSDFGFVSRIAGVVHQLIAKPATHWPNKRDGANRRP